MGILINKISHLTHTLSWSQTILLRNAVSKHNLLLFSLLPNPPFLTSKDSPSHVHTPSPLQTHTYIHMHAYTHSRTHTHTSMQPSLLSVGVIQLWLVLYVDPHGSSIMGVSMSLFFSFSRCYHGDTVHQGGLVMGQDHLITKMEGVVRSRGRKKWEGGEG